jgi:D-hexose-6-phosphate mutarotase
MRVLLQAAKNNEERHSLGLFGLLRKESWGAKDNSKGKTKGRVTFALPRSDSKKKKTAKAEGRLENCKFNNVHTVKHTKCVSIECV